MILKVKEISLPKAALNPQRGVCQPRRFSYILCYVWNGNVTYASSVLLNIIVPKKKRIISFRNLLHKLLIKEIYKGN